MSGWGHDIGGAIRLLMWLAVPGAIVTVAGIGWLIYHLARAVLFYVGVL